MASAVAKNGDQVRVVLWAPPRSLSTAFERCISTLHTDHALQIWHEPFTTSFHLGPEKQAKRKGGYFARMATTDPTYSYSWVRDQLEDDFADKKIVFFKDLGYSVDGKFEYIPRGYQHTFLIRHPKLVLTSFSNLLRKFPTILFRVQLSDIFPKGYVYKEMYDLYIHLTEVLGEDVLIIDAEDLIARPLDVLKIYCEKTGIPFDKNMIRWRPCDEDMDDWMFSKKLMTMNRIVGQYDRALTSDGLGKPSNRVVDVTKYSNECQRAISMSEPYYMKLYQKRFQLPESAENT